MERKKKIEPLREETLEEFIKRQQSRKGIKNKNSDTLSFKEIYKELPFKKSIPYSDYMKIVNETCKTMRSLLVKGHNVVIPYFGTLESRFTERKNIDNREINYKKLLEYMFNKKNENINVEQETYKHRFSLPMISIVLTSKGKNLTKIHSARFCPMKYLIRELKNILFGTEYYVEPY